MSTSDTHRSYDGGTDCHAIAEFVDSLPNTIIDLVAHFNPNYDVRESPTYTTSGYATRIDYAFASFTHPIQSSRILTLHGLPADHNPILTTIDLAALNATKCPTIRRNPTTLLHVDPKNDDLAKSYAARCEEWANNLDPDLAQFLSPTMTAAGEPMALVDRALDAFTELATTIASKVYPKKTTIRSDAQVWKSAFSRNSDAGLLLRDITASRRARRAFKSLQQYYRNEIHLTQAAIQHRIDLINSHPDQETTDLATLTNQESGELWMEKSIASSRCWQRRLTRRIRKVNQHNNQDFTEAVEREGKANSKQLRHLLTKRTRPPDLLALLDDDHKLLIEPDAIKAKISRHFAKMAERPPPVATQDLPWRNPEINQAARDRMRRSGWVARLAAPLTLDDTRSSIGGDTAPGRDGVQYTVMRVMPDQPLQYLTNVLNTVIRTKQATPSLKAGEIVLLHKTGSPLALTNFRGVTLLRTPFKTITTTLAKRLTAATEECGSFSNATGGARPGRTCGHKVQTLLNVLAHARRTRRPVFLLVADISKAFPTTPFVGFDHGLEDIGCGEDFIQLHRALQDDTRCTVRTPYGQTDPHPCDNGCKEGCGASPGRYALYMDMFHRWVATQGLGYRLSTSTTADNANPLDEQNVEVTSAGFLDDTTLLSDVHENCQTLTDRLVQFLDSYGQFLNRQKSFFALLRCRSDVTYLRGCVDCTTNEHSPLYLLR